MQRREPVRSQSDATSHAFGHQYQFQRPQPAARTDWHAPPRPSLQLEVVDNGGGNEARAGNIEMLVPLLGLLMRVEALRNHEHEPVFGAGHRHVEQPPLLLDVLCGAGCHVRGDTTIDRVEDEDCLHSWPLAEWMVERMR